MHISLCSYISFCCDQCGVSYIWKPCEPPGFENGCSYGCHMGHHALLGKHCVLQYFSACLKPMLLHASAFSQRSARIFRNILNMNSLIGFKLHRLFLVQTYSKNDSCTMSPCLPIMGSKTELIWSFSG